jgi:hypothetical protein
MGWVQTRVIKAAEWGICGLNRGQKSSNRSPGQQPNQKKQIHAKAPEKSKSSESTPRWRKPIIWAGGVGTLVVAGILTGLLTPPAQRLAEPTEPASTTAPTASPKATSASDHYSRPKSSSTPLTSPLSIVSEDPLNVDDLGVWAFPNKIPFSSSQLNRVNLLLRRALVNVYTITHLANYFYALGGYAINADTQLVLQNDSSQPVSILDMRVIKNCGSPLSGTLFDSPAQGSDDDIRIGFNLDSADTDAESAKGWDTAFWRPDYFENKYISFAPGQQRILNIRAVTTKHACTFSYELVALEGKTKFYQTINDDGQPFRANAIVSSGPNGSCARYAALYFGGALSPFHHHGDYIKENPRTSPC